MHRADARAKLFLLLAYSVGIFFVSSWWGMAVATAMLLAAFAASKLPVKAVFASVVPVYILAGITVLFNAFGSQAGFAFTLDGLERGCFFGLRICLLVWASLIVCYSTTSTQLVDAFVWFMKPLRALHVPVDDIAMVLSIALRFIPLIVAEFQQVKDAQWSRGAAFDEGGLIARIKAHMAILMPLIVGLFRRAERLAEAMDARCYGMEKRNS
ncbi:MAG: energy-coupling factor transporter transmembrane protein EcfT [Eggerthellaceae bacterium]|nr:energy-coupling factor transporter transmembrane protein EcfT [Eggerthellaceae bacterium]